MIRMLCVAMMACVILAACGEEDAQPNRPRTIVVAGLTIEQVRESALAALDAEGQVFHLTTTEEARGRTATTEYWIDYERDLARVESGDQLRVVYDRRIAFLMDGRFHDAIYDVPGEKASPHELHYMRWLLDETADLEGIEESVVDREPAIRVRLERDMYDYDARESAKIDLSEAFLPLRQEVSNPLGEGSIEYTSEFVPRESLSPTFFTPQDVEARAAPVVQSLIDAREAGIDPYWLGQQFEETVLRDESRFDPDMGGDSVASLRLHYGAPGQEVAPSPCIMIREYTREAWDDLIEGVREDNPESLLLRDPDETIDVPAGEALLFLGPSAPDFPTPRVGPPLFTPEPGATPPPGPPPLPVVPDDTGESLQARLLLDTTVVEVDVNCGPRGSNLYRTRDAFMRVLQALRPFQEP